MKHSARKINKKYLPKGLIRKLDKSDGKRKWFLGKDKKWDTLHQVVLDLGYTTKKKSLDSHKGTTKHSKQ